MSFPSWSGKHSLICRVARSGALVHNLSDVSILFVRVSPGNSGGDEALFALRDAAIPFLKITDKTSEEKLVLVMNMAHRLDVPVNIHVDLATAAGDRGAELCIVASDAVRLAKRFECTSAQHSLFEQFALKLGVDGMNPSIALELLRESSMDISVARMILNLVVPSLSSSCKEGEEHKAFFEELKELASFAVDHDEDGEGSKPIKTIILAAKVGIVRQAMELAGSFCAESGAHGVLLDFIERNKGLPDEPSAIVFAHMVRSYRFRGEDVATRLAVICKKNDWGFNPVEFISRRMRNSSHGATNFGSILRRGLLRVSGATPCKTTEGFV